MAGVFAGLVSFGTDLSGLELFDPENELGDLGQFGFPTLLAAGAAGIKIPGVSNIDEFLKALPQVAQLVLIGAVLVGVALVAAIALPSVLGVVGAITSPGRFGLD